MRSKRQQVVLGALLTLVVMCGLLVGVTAPAPDLDWSSSRSSPSTSSTVPPSTATSSVAASTTTITVAAAAPVATDPAPTTTSSQRAGTPTTRPTAPSDAAPVVSAGARPAPRLPWFAPSASWNRPVSDFGPSATLQEYASRWWAHGGGAAPAGTVNVAFGDYSVPVYPLTEATTFARIYQTTWSMELYDFGAPLGTQIPWNPAWRPGTGNDNILAIVDESTGRTWEIGGVGQQNGNCANRGNVAAAERTKDWTSVYLCVSGVRLYDNLFTATDGSTIDGRGAGINKLALLTRADEVRAGAIRHALQMTITSSMFAAPACDPVRGAAAPGAGVSCGFYLPPATKIERLDPNVGCAEQAVTDGERSKTVPEGMRFALRIDDAEIEQWLDSRGYGGQLRSTARVFAVALRDYGWIIAETGCWGMHIETDSVIGASGETWAKLGVVSNGSSYPHGDLLAGLFTPSRVYVVAPPG